MPPLFIDSELGLAIVLGAEGTAVSWRDRVFVLVTDEAGRGKHGWNLNFELYLKSSSKLLKGCGQVRNMTISYFRYTVLTGVQGMDFKG